MKKFFTLTVMAVVLSVLGANGQTLRKTWDFREGFSQKTVNALKADQEEFGDSKYWRNYEGDATKADDQHFWCASAEAKNENGYACTHNGGNEKVISELDGLKLGFTAAKKFVITYNGAQSPNEYEAEGTPAVGEMIPHGKSYLWLNGKSESITFQAQVNQKIRIGVESHAVNRTKVGEARGISLSASGGTLTPNFEGNPVPTYYTEYSWELSGEDGAIADLTIKSTNGCHIYFIIVGDGDDPDANKSKVAYLTAGDATGEEAYQLLAANSELLVTPIDLSQATLTTEQLAAYDANIVSPALPVDNASVSVLKEAIAFYPILNLNANLYAAWGYGEAVNADMPIAQIKNLKNVLVDEFVEGVDYIFQDELNIVQLSNGDSFTGVKFTGEYFANDDIVVTDGSDEIVAVHAHNLFQNAYVYMPFDKPTDAAMKLMQNAISALKASKSEITKAAAPKITFEYKNLFTNVVMSMASSSYKMGKIYYTTDGTEPTEASTLYTDVLTVTEPTTFKAVAIADGYLLSEVAEAKAEIYSQPATPQFDIDYQDGKTVVSINTENADVDLWYNFSEATDTVNSMKYTEPLVITAPTTLTAFAVAGGMVYSEPATQRVTVKNPVVRIDQIGLFDANATDWQNGGGSTVYYFSWGKNARSMYDKTQEGETTVDPETGDEVTVYPEYDYEYYVPAAQEEGAEPAWEVKSKGQVMIWQSLTAGSDPGNAGGYNPETAGDMLSYAKITSNDIQFGGKASGEPYTGAIQSRVKFAGPFDVATIVGTAAGGSNVGKMLIEVSTDSLNWTAVGDTMKTSTVKRLWKTYVRSYEGTDEVYVRIVQAGGGSSVQIYNMYLLNAGEESTAKQAEYQQEYEEQMSGIETKRVKVAASGIFNLNGMQQNAFGRGLNIVRYSDGQVRKVMVK